MLSSHYEKFKNNSAALICMMLNTVDALAGYIIIVYRKMRIFQVSISVISINYGLHHYQKSPSIISFVLFECCFYSLFTSALSIPLLSRKVVNKTVLYVWLLDLSTSIDRLLFDLLQAYY